MSIKIEGLDTEKGLDMYDNELEDYVTVLRSFAESTHEVMDNLRNVTAETLDDYEVAVHGLKSAGATIGAMEARSKAIELETLAKAGDIPGILARNDEFLKYIETLIRNIQNWLNQYDSKSV